MHKTLQDVEARLAACASCQRSLPLREADRDERPKSWTCVGCETEIQGVLAGDYSIDELRNVRPEAICFDRDQIPPSPPEMVEFARRIAIDDLNSVEKRTSTRHSMVAIVPALELDSQLEPTGQGFMTTCRNISTGGICLLNERVIASDFVLLELAAPSADYIHVLARVLRRRPLGPYHDIGGEFVTRFARPSSRA